MPNPLELIGRQLAIGVGRVAARAVARAAKSVASDVRQVGRTIQKRAKAEEERLEAIWRMTHGAGSRPASAEHDDDEEDDL